MQTPWKEESYGREGHVAMVAQGKPRLALSGRMERVEEGSTSQVLSQVKSCFHSGGVRVCASSGKANLLG